MDFLPLLEKWGPAFLGWAGFVYVGRFVLDRYQQDIDAKVKLALALEELSKLLRESTRYGRDS